MDFPFDVAQLGGWSLFISFVTLMFQRFIAGKLYGERAVQRMLDQAGLALAAETRRADLMQAAWEKSQAANDLVNAASQKLSLESAQTMARVLESIQRLGERREGDDVST